MTEIVTGETILVPEGIDDYKGLHLFFQAAEERGHPAPSVVVDESGKPITHPWYDDRMGVPHLKAGAWAFCRKPRAEALGLPTGTDYVESHEIHLKHVYGSPYAAAPSFPSQLYVQTFGDPYPRPQIPVCVAGPVAWRPDGQRICVIDGRGAPAVDSLTFPSYVIWEYEIAIQRRRRVVALPRTWTLDLCEMTYSSDGEWLHLCNWAHGGNVLVRVSDGAVVPLPFNSTGVGWNPRIGPNAMVVTSVDPRTGALIVSDYDVSTGSLEQRCEVPSPNGLPLKVRELSMSIDGTRALVTAPLGAPGVEQQRRGGVNVAVLIDTVDGVLDTVLPVRFLTGGAERRHTSPRWCEHQIVSATPTMVAERLLAKAATPRTEPDGEVVLHRHVDMWMEIAAGIEQAWTRGRISPAQFAEELVQFVVSCCEIDQETAKPMLQRLSDRARFDPAIRAVTRWIDRDRRTGSRSSFVDQIADLAQTAIEVGNPEEFADIFAADRHQAADLIDRLIAAEDTATAGAAASQLVNTLSNTHRGDVSWQRLAVLTTDAVARGKYLFAARAGLATLVWNQCYEPGDDWLRRSALGRTPDGDAITILIDCIEACGHLAGDEILGEDSQGIYDVTATRIRAHNTLSQFDVSHHLIMDNRRVGRRAEPSMPAPDPGVIASDTAPKLSRKRIFVSYVHEDSARVVRLVDELKHQGFNVWMDRTHLLVGQKWKSEVRKAIKSGDFFVACFSVASTTKRLSYVNEELITAVEQLRLMPRSSQWFIPVLLEPCALPDLPIGPNETITDVHHVDLSIDWNVGIEALLRALGPALII